MRFRGRVDGLHSRVRYHELIPATALGSGAACTEYTGGTNTTGNRAVQRTQTGLN